MPDGSACVLTSSNERADVPCAKRRFPGPVAVGKIAVIGGMLDHAVQRDVFDDFELSHWILRVIGVKALPQMQERLSLQPHDEPPP